MKKLLIITLILITALVAIAADKTYYSYPNAKRLRDTGRVLYYDNLSGSRNLTGAQLKSEIVTQTTVNAAIATATNGTPLIKRSGSGDGQYVRQFEVKNASGVITMWINTLGQMVFGTPVSLAVSSVSPANGATNVSNGTWFNFSTAGTGWARINTTTPTVTYNKYEFPSAAISPTGGSTAGSSDNTRIFSNFSGVPGAVYTITTNLSTQTQSDGETAWSCGAGMTNVANVCTSTFQMKP